MSGLLLVIVPRGRFAEGAGLLTVGGAHLTPPTEPALTGFEAEAPADATPGGPGIPLLPGAQGSVYSRQGEDEQSTESAHLLAEELVWGNGPNDDPLPATEGEPLAGAAAEGGGLVVPGHSGEHPREAALAAAAGLLAETAVARNGHLQPAEDQGALLPAVPVGEQAGDDFAAWDGAEDSIVPLLWAVGPLEDEEGNGPLSRYSRKDEEI